MADQSDSEYTTDSDHNDQLPPRKKKKQGYIQKYRKAWEKDSIFKGWLQPVPGNAEKAYCKLCCKKLTAVVTLLKRHKQSASHIAKEEELHGPRPSRSIDSMFVSTEKDKLVKDAEIKMAVFIAEHNLPFNMMDHFSELLPKLCPDSPTALRFKSKRTRTKCIIANACAPYFHENLRDSLATTHFSIIIDETTDVSTQKELAIVCRFYQKEQKKVLSHFYNMIPITDGTAESLYGSVLSLLSEDNIPISNLIGFAADTTNVMFGGQNSVATRLKADIPHIFLMKCVCHSAHLCASYACGKLPRSVEELLRDIYNYFAHSAKRQSQYAVVQHFLDVEPHKLLRPCQTRWLSLHSCVTRVIEQWDALILYFKEVSQHDHLLVSEKICSMLQNPVWKLYFHFLNFVLAKFTDLNTMFQSSTASIHAVYSKTTSVYKDFLSCFMTEASWRYVDNLNDIDPKSTTHHLPLKNMYMGARVSLCLAQDIYQDRSRAPDISHFLKCCQAFYIEASIQIKTRFAISDPVMKNLQVLDPRNPFSMFPSLVTLASRFPNILPEQHLEQLDSEWRRLSLASLPFDKSDMEPEEFWGAVDEIKNGLGTPLFPRLCSFMQALLALPSSNADVERVFSSLNSIKTKHRNKLHSSTVSSLLKVKNGVKHDFGSCVSFKPSDEIRRRMDSSILYASTLDQEDDPDSD